MPKGNKKKGKSMGYGKFRTEKGSSEEDSVNDNCSVISATSEGTNVDEAEEEVDEQAQSDVFEEKLMEAIEGMTLKSAQGRTSSLEAVSLAFSKRYVPEFVIERRLTLTDGIEKSLKKGRGLEQAAAAHLATLLCVQLGSGDCTDAVCRDLSPLLTHIVTDDSMPLTARSKCCWALGYLSFMANTEGLGDAMATLHQVFGSSYHKGDGSVPCISQDLANLHYSALSSWALLLTVVDLESVPDLPSIVLLSQLLDSSHLDVRMAAGEGIALLLEQGRQLRSDSFWGVNDEILDKLRQLATDSHKYRAKKDRKTQRSSFRDILRYVECDESPNIQVRFGQESLSLATWSKKKQYDCFCQLLGSGMNIHLTENEFLREILELGDKISPLNAVTNKQTKLARHLRNAANFKARSISRGKNRDKRSVVIIQ